MENRWDLTYLNQFVCTCKFAIFSYDPPSFLGYLEITITVAVRAAAVKRLLLHHSSFTCFRPVGL